MCGATVYLEDANLYCNGRYGLTVSTIALKLRRSTTWVLVEMCDATEAPHGCCIGPVKKKDHFINANFLRIGDA